MKYLFEFLTRSSGLVSWLKIVFHIVIPAGENFFNGLYKLI